MVLIWVIVFVAYTVINILALALSVIVIPLALVCRAYKVRESKIWPGKQIVAWSWAWMYPWGNEEDGIVAGGELIGPDTFNLNLGKWVNIKITVNEYPEWLRILYWSAIRNPTNNLRFLINPKVEPPRLQFRSNFPQESFALPMEFYERMKELEEGRVVPNFWYLIWQGPYAGFRAEYKGWRLWIGFKFYPSSIVKVPEYQKYGVGFTLSFKRLRTS